MSACLSPNPPAPALPDLNRLFRGLVQQHGERLRRFVARHVGNPSEAEELAQQAFVEAACTYASFRGDSQASTWLYGIALNLVRNHLSRASHGATSSTARTRWPITRAAGRVVELALTQRTRLPAG